MESGDRTPPAVVLTVFQNMGQVERKQIAAYQAFKQQDLPAGPLCNTSLVRFSHRTGNRGFSCPGARVDSREKLLFKTEEGRRHALDVDVIGSSGTFSASCIGNCKAQIFTIQLRRRMYHATTVKTESVSTA